MPAVADVDGDPAERRLKHGVPRLAFHVVRALVEVADAGDVILAVLAEDGAVGVDDDGGVPQRVRVGRVAFEDRRDDDHAELLREGGQERCARAGHCKAAARLSEACTAAPLLCCDHPDDSMACAGRLGNCLNPEDPLVRAWWRV